MVTLRRCTQAVCRATAVAGTPLVRLTTVVSEAGEHLLGTQDLTEDLTAEPGGVRHRRGRRAIPLERGTPSVGRPAGRGRPAARRHPSGARRGQRPPCELVLSQRGSGPGRVLALYSEPTSELQATNSGVVALYAELEDDTTAPHRSPALPEPSRRDRERGSHRAGRSLHPPAGAPAAGRQWRRGPDGRTAERRPNRLTDGRRPGTEGDWGRVASSAAAETIRITH